MLLPQLNCANLAKAQKYLHILFDSFTSHRLASYHSPLPPLLPSPAALGLMPIPLAILPCPYWESAWFMKLIVQLTVSWLHAKASLSLSLCLPLCLSVCLSACVRARFLQCICVCTLYRLFHITQVIIKILAGAAAIAAASLINCGSGSLTTSFPCSTRPQRQQQLLLQQQQQHV